MKDERADLRSDRCLSDPWGTFAGDRVTRGLIRACRAVPTLPLVRQLVFPIRRLARARVDGPIDHRLWGYRLRFWPTGNVGEGHLLFFPRRWDPVERAFLARRLQPGATFVDVGANFGGYTWWVSSRLGPRVRVVAIEPDPDLHETLRFNLETNGIDTVSLVRVAAGASAGTAELHLHPENRGQNSLVDPELDQAETRRVEVRPLARILEDAGVDHVDAMKIDIEGMEPPVLERFFDDAPRSLWPRILIAERGEDPAYARLRDRLSKSGYRFVHMTRMNMVAELQETE